MLVTNKQNQKFIDLIKISETGVFSNNHRPLNFLTIHHFNEVSEDRFNAIAQNMEVSIRDFVQHMWPNPLLLKYLVKLTEETLNGKLYFLCIVPTSALLLLTSSIFQLLQETCQFSQEVQMTSTNIDSIKSFDLHKKYVHVLSKFCYEEF